MPYKIVIVNTPFDEIKKYIDDEIGFDAVKIQLGFYRSTKLCDQYECHLKLNSIFLAKKTAAKFNTKWQKIDEEKGA